MMRISFYVIGKSIIGQEISFRRSTRSCVSIRSSFGDWQDGEHGILWESPHIAQVVGGIQRKHGLPGSICTDSRKIHHGEWFLALVGDHFDGNRFLADALAAGCAGAIGRKMPEDWPVGFVEVEDTLQALHMLAISVRARYTGHVIGITGSCGKTTTRAITSLALESFGHIHQTRGNMNNHIGLPLTLLEMPSNSSACVLEMGMNHAGEILTLSRIASPQTRVVLNVGPVHLENFASVEEIAASKGELFTDASMGNTCILNADDPLVMALPVPNGARTKLFGRSEASDLRLLNVEVTDGGGGVSFTLQQGEFASKVDMHCPGVHHATNACAAVCVATSLGVPLDVASRSISRFSTVGMRSRLETLSWGVKLINDAYNANPVSMTVALDILEGLRGRKVVALGDMLELGSISQAAHLDTIKRCQNMPVGLIALAGSQFCDALDSQVPGECEVLKCESSAILAKELVKKLRPGDVVLVKGSRGMKMELVADAIKSTFA